MITQREIYLDANATHPLLASVKKRLANALNEDNPALGNPSSIHRKGQKAKGQIAEFRELLCQVLGRPDGDEFVFVSGATEALNLALRGFVADRKSKSRQVHLLASAIEHKAVLDTCEALHAQGSPFSILPVDASGQLNAESLVNEIETILLNPSADVLLCVQMVNNETGVEVATVKLLSALFDKFSSKPQTHLPKIKGGKYPTLPQRVFICVDAAQAFLKVSDTLVRQCLHFADAAAFSAHKVGGASGVGLLWHRASFAIQSQMTGGTQERRRRAGTQNALGLLSFRYAIEDWLERGDQIRSQWQAMRLELVQELLKIEGLQLHGLGENRELPLLANTINFHVEGCPEESLLLALDLDGFCLSSGSACNSGSLKPSHVILGMGFSEEVALSSLRVSFGTDTTRNEVQEFVIALTQKVAQIRKARLASKEIFGESENRI